MQSRKWLGRCPECSAWNSFTEQTRAPRGKPATTRPNGGRAQRLGELGSAAALRRSSGFVDFDRVLGGGVVPGSVVLVGGEPGIGKSTLLLQIAARMSTAPEGRVLYVSGEESVEQLELRAARLGIAGTPLQVLAETCLENVLVQVRENPPAVLIVDSIQTLYSTESPAGAGSIGQVRDCAGALLALGKSTGIAVFIIGHVTKDGALAGPKSLEHLVDTVLYFEGDRSHQHRLLRAYKNRFGPTGEIAIFEMCESGLAAVPNPSAVLLAERSHLAAGSAVVACMEGTRPLLIEVQALVAATRYPSPRRMAVGVDSNRVVLLLAVLEKRSGLSFVDRDVFVNVVGGLEVSEPAADLGIAAALVSSLRDRALPAELAFFGEVGLLGEVRGVGNAGARLRETLALGFSVVMAPRGSAALAPAGLEVVEIARVEDLVRNSSLRGRAE